MLRYCTFSSIYTTTWCYATARSLQFTQLRDAMLLHVRFNLHDWGGWVGGGDVNVHWTCTLTWCYATARSLQFTQLRDARLTGVGGWGGGWAGMLTFIGLAHLRDATLLHVLFNLYNYVMFSSIYTTTYATARSLQFTQLRDAMLLHVRFNLHNYVMLRWVGGWGGMLTFIGLAHLRDATLLHVLWRNLFFPIFTEKWRLWWGQRSIHLCDVVVSNMCGDVISKLVHHWSCWKSWQSWWKTTTPTTAKRVEKRRFDAETL